MKKIFLPQLHPSNNLDQPALWFIFKKEEILLLCNDKNHTTIPQFTNIAALDLKMQCQYYLGIYDTMPCYVAELDEIAIAPENMLFQTIRGSDGLCHNEDLFLIASRAKQILNWDKTTKFCGCCGHTTQHSDKERAKLCSQCNTIFYPQISPVVLTLVWRKNEILLARSPHFQKDIYSILAGFVEPGETLEFTAAREVKEEVGINIKNLRYFGSQPWPFPSNLMLGFTAEYANGELVIDSVEIEDAKWFNITDLPSLPTPLSLSRKMIDAFLKAL